MYYVYKDGKKVFEGTQSEVAKLLKISTSMVKRCGSMLGYTKGYQIVSDDENRQRKTWLNDDLIIKRINEGKTYKEIAKELNYPVEGLTQYCKDREYTPANRGHIEKKEIFYPGGYKQCPRCKRWFNNYAGSMWHWKGLGKNGKPIWYCSYTCMRNSEVKWW